MAVTNITYNINSQGGSRVNSDVQQAFNGIRGIQEELAIMNTMLSGDGTDVSHFTLVASRYGIPTNQEAMDLRYIMTLVANGDMTKLDELYQRTRP